MPSQTLSADLLRRLASHGGVRRFARGEILVQEGARGGGIFILLSGRANVFTAGADGRELIYNTLHAGEILVQEGARGGGIFILLSGRANVFTAGADGRELIYNTLHAGEILGELFLDGGVRSASVRATEAVECIHVGEDELSAFMAANPEFAEFLVITLIQRLRHATALVRRLGLNDVSERVIDVLRSESKLVDGQLLLPRSLTQQEISQRVGATREMVNHVVRKLMKLGYLRRTGQRQVEVIRALPDSIRSLPNDQA
jgi:CRP/FNR family cyclic AMP-dependent transcriptional regulator